MMSTLFSVTVPTINEHLKNVFSSSELEPDSVVRKFRTTAADGKSYLTQFYNLNAIISVGYRINSKRATQFRQWATRVLREFYLRMTRKLGWSKSVLIHQIENQSYEKSLLGQIDFDKALTPELRAQAKLAVKDEYTFDFLELRDTRSSEKIDGYLKVWRE